MIRILRQRDYQLRKVKVIKVFFVEFKVNFSKFNTQNPMQSLSASAQWNLQKISCLLCISFCPFSLSSSRNCYPNFTSKSLYSGHQIVSRHHTSRICFSDSSGVLGHLTFRNWYSNSSSDFRTSYFQKLLLRSIKQLQDILLPEIIIITMFTVYYFMFKL